MRRSIQVSGCTKSLAGNTDFYNKICESVTAPVECLKNSIKILEIFSKINFGIEQFQHDWPQLSILYYIVFIFL